MSRARQLAAAAALAATIVGCSEEVPPAEPPLRPIRTEVVRTTTDAIPSTLAGVAKAGLESNLSFRVNGTLIRLPAIVGRDVRRGEVLGRLDPTDYELSVEESKASLAQAEAALRQAIADYGRVRALYENNNASKSELDAARANFESAEAQVDAAEKRLAQSEQQLGYTVLRAPVAGAVASVEVEVNETISAGQAIVRLTSGVLPEIEVAVSEVTIPYVAEGMTTSVELDAIPGERFTGTVTEVGVATAAGSSTYPVTVQLEVASPMIRSGMAAEVTFSFEDPGQESRLDIPLVAVGEDQNGRYVFVVEAEGEGTATVRRRPVTVGRFSARGVEIVEGLQPGEVIATAGVRRLVDGMRVRYEAGAS